MALTETLAGQVVIVGGVVSTIFTDALAGALQPPVATEFVTITLTVPVAPLPHLIVIELFPELPPDITVPPVIVQECVANVLFNV